MKIKLHDNWVMKKVDDSQWMSATVPGSMYNDLLNHQLMDDPFYRENEYAALDLCQNDYEYKCTFDVDASIFLEDQIMMIFEGLDTLCDITLNSKILASVNNMHRTYRYDVKDLLKMTGNELHLYFHSPTEFIEAANKKDYLWGVSDAVEGIAHLRKAHCMFGWDWGPRLPDMGIFRAISLESYKGARIDEVYVTQNHMENRVELDIAVNLEKLSAVDLKIHVKVSEEEGQTYSAVIETRNNQNHLKINIDHPKLWWPNNYGGQHLYQVKVYLEDMEGRQLSCDHKQIGLRTLTVRQEKDQWGKSFEIVINGMAIFAMGADYIPEDNILARCTKDKTEKLIKSCVMANMNCIRVWGGGYYPDDYFYDLCDTYGLIVWQDLMFACAVYRLTDEFTKNITEEVKDNVKRIRHHASLGLWCGNNEMEMAFVEWPYIKDLKGELREDYIKQYEKLLPEIVGKADPNTFYWKASPSSGGNFVNPNSENEGDVHDWTVWHGSAPFSYFEEHYYRFLSEFGLQSFPGLKTVKTFTEEEDRNIFSSVMENHQKNSVSNSKILHYIASDYKYPKDFDSLLYASQLVQAEGIKYGVEHMRRHRGRCMGAVYWQLNDCWQVASWSSIDYFGRWKALQYAARHFFNPVLVSASPTKRLPMDDLTLSNRYYSISENIGARINVSNDTREILQGILKWQVKNNKSEVLQSGAVEVNIDALSAGFVSQLDFSDLLTTRTIARSSYLSFQLIKAHKVLSENTVLFVKAKHFDLLEPQIKAEVKDLGDAYEVTLKAEAFAMSVEVDLIEDDAIFSDNYFNMDAYDEKVIHVSKDDLSRHLTRETFIAQLKIRSLYDMA